jgi:hypothetical protein|tara:strand:- start:1699 stop:2391 length:693 start_codon:yes stop_codon:yes gene_type:complete
MDKKTSNKNKNKTVYRLMKLTTGEEIMTRIIGQVENKYIITDPMAFHIQPIFNGMSVNQLTVLRKWSEHSADRKIKIPKSMVLLITKPTKSAAELYELEIARLYKNPVDKKITKLTDLFSNGKLPFPTPPTPESFDMDSTPESLFEDMKDKDDENTKDFIMMSLMLPPSILRDLLDGGYLDDEDLTSMLDQYEKEMKKELPDYTGDDKDHPDYGNRFTDWDFDFDGEDYG